MTREEFIKVLDGKEYSYEIEGDKIIVTYKGDLYLSTKSWTPPDVPDEELSNRWDEWSNLLTSLPSGVEFRNERHVYLEALTSLPPGVEFRNGGYVYLSALIGGWLHEWEGNIKGIDSKRLLNLMISKGMFI